METIPVNWWAVLVAAVAKFLIGWVWYGVAVGEPWRAAVGLSHEDIKKGMGKAIPVDFIANLVMAYVLARLIGYAGAGTIVEGALIGFMAWIGFVAAVTLSTTFYEQRPLKLFLLNNIYLLVTIVVMGAIIAAWTGAPAAMAPA